MKIISLFSLFLMLFPARMAAQLSATATPTAANCPASGTIKVMASGGSTPYRYSITSGPITRAEQSADLFADLPQGTYTVQVKDNNNAVFTIPNLVISSNYITMQPTANAQAQVCPGSNTGSIQLNMAAGQGAPPYTYTIEEGPVSASPVTTTTSGYTFPNLAPGFYRVRVTDNCGAFQTREATVIAAASYDLTVDVFARSSACGSTDYYIRPNLGNNYPQTLYAYTGSTLVKKIEVTSADLVPIPGTSFAGFKFTLPDPATFPGTYYTFKRTDNCITNVDDPRVKPNTPGLGAVNLSVRSNNNCGLDLTAFAGDGWKMPVTVSATPVGGGTAVSQKITDETTRTTVFSTLAAGTYVVTFTDECGRTRTQNAVMQNTLVANVSVGCGANIPGTSNASIYGLTNGWKYPVTATITSGPTSYFSVFMNKTYSSSYPQVVTSTEDGYVRLSNIAPGSYSVTLNDGCNTKTIELVIPAGGAAYNIPQETVSGCAGSRKMVSTAAASCAGAFYADIKKGTGEAVYGNGIGAGNGFTLTNVPADVYTIYYYSNIIGWHPVLTIPGEDIYNGRFLAKKSTINVTDQPTNPTVSGANTVKCANGSVMLQLIPGGNSGAITGYQIKNPDGNYGPLQSSPVFTVSDYGTYEFRLVDECQNSNVTAVSIAANPAPAIKTRGNQCLGEDITLYVDLPAGATATWTKPDGSQVTGAELLIAHASLADRGVYTAIVTYTISSCSEAQTTSVTLGDCIALPVSWSDLQATLKDGQLYVNWKTLTEVNNSHFEVQISSDGIHWKSIGKVATLAAEGNSNTAIDYMFNTGYKDALALLGGSVMMALIGAGFKRRNKYLATALFAAAVVFACVAAGCKKHKDLTVDNQQQVFARVLQVDKDGTSKASKVVRAITE